MTICGIAVALRLLFIQYGRFYCEVPAQRTNEAGRMSFEGFKVLTFDVVGTLIDFETGVVEAFRAIGGPAAAKLTENKIFAPDLVGRDEFPGRSSRVMRDVYL